MLYLTEKLCSQFLFYQFIKKKQILFLLPAIVIAFLHNSIIKFLIYKLLTDILTLHERKKKENVRKKKDISDTNVFVEHVRLTTFRRLDNGNLR